MEGEERSITRLEQDPLEQLSGRPYDMKELKDCLKKPKDSPPGTFVFLGPQGSGKTTTMNSVAKYVKYTLHVPKTNILSIGSGATNAFSDITDIYLNYSETDGLTNIREMFRDGHIDHGSMLLIDDATGHMDAIFGHNSWTEVFTTLRKRGLYVLIGVHAISKIPVGLRTQTNLIFVTGKLHANNYLLLSQLMGGIDAKEIAEMVKHYAGFDKQGGTHQSVVLSIPRGTMYVLNDTVGKEK